MPRDGLGLSLSQYLGDANGDRSASPLFRWLAAEPRAYSRPTAMAKRGR